MPLLLFSYLTAEILGPFFASLLIINAILFLGKLSSLLDAIFSFGVSFADFCRISIFMMPNLLLFSVPMASTLGVVIAFTRLTGDNEILAFKAAGISLYRLLVPVVLVALCTSALTGLTSSLLVPDSSLALRQTFYQLAREKIDKGFRAKEFSDSIRDVVIYVDQIDSRTGEWLGVFISDQRDRQSPLTIIARRGSLAADLDSMTVGLELLGGTMHRNSNDSSQTIRFKSYNLELPLSSIPPVAKAHKNDLSPLELLNQAAALHTAAEQDAANGDRLAVASLAMLIEFHKRLVLPVGCLILTILALPLALQSRPGQSRTGLPLALFFFFLYYILISFAKSLAETSGLPVGPVMWTPNLLFGLLALVFVRAAARENSVKVLDRLTDFYGRLLNRFKTLTGRGTQA